MVWALLALQFLGWVGPIIGGNWHGWQCFRICIYPLQLPLSVQVHRIYFFLQLQTNTTSDIIIPWGLFNNIILFTDSCPLPISFLSCLPCPLPFPLPLPLPILCSPPFHGPFISKRYFSFWNLPGVSERMWSVNFEASISQEYQTLGGHSSCPSE